MRDVPSEPVPRMGVIICTRNRADKIGAAVQSVIANEHPSFDLSIVDQSTDESTRTVVASVGDPRIHYCHSSVQGLSRAYNQGISLSTAPLLAFTDDDCVVPPDWLSRIELAFELEPEADLLYGQVLPKSEDPAERNLTPALPLAKAERLSRVDGFRVVGMGANFAARRRLFDRIGGFDEVLGGGGALRSSQDFDLAYRAYRAGSVILLRPDVTLLHDGMRQADDWPRLFRDYGIGDGAFYSKHVRCGDIYALRLMMRQIWQQGIRVVGRPLLGRDRRPEYLAGMFDGIRTARRFEIDRQLRRYAAS